jgi:hypothetical protein
MVEAVNHCWLHPTSILDVYKVFEHLHMLYVVDGRCLRTFICRKVVAGVGRRSVTMMTARSMNRVRLARVMAMATTAIHQ